MTPTTDDARRAIANLHLGTARAHLHAAGAFVVAAEISSGCQVGQFKALAGDALAHADHHIAFAEDILERPELTDHG